MAKHRAVIIGAGRIGAGYKWPEHPYVYTHADAYRTLEGRVELLGFIETDPERGVAATEKYGIPASRDYRNLELLQADIVSVCVQPTDQGAVLEKLYGHAPYLKGIWMEKPFLIQFPLRPEWKIQVNYIRRFDKLHQSVKGEIDAGKLGRILKLVVMAKKDVHTDCHFYDLAHWWGVPQGDVVYADTTGTEYVNTEYELIGTKGKVRFFQGGMSAQIYGTAESKWFPGAIVPESRGQVEPKAPKVFMQQALANLLDAVEGKAALQSPPY